MPNIQEYKLKDFRQYFKDNHLECINGYFHEDSMQNIFVVSGTSREVAEFMAKIARKHSAPILITDETDLFLITRRITDQMITRRNYGAMYEKISNIAIQYNKDLDAKYFEEAPAFKIIVPVGSIFYCYEKEEPENEALSGHDKLDEIEEKFADVIEKEREEIRNSKHKEKQEFEKAIEKDPEFALCTTKQLRRTHVLNIIRQNKQSEWFREVYSNEGGFTQLGLDAVCTRIFNRLKDAKKRTKS